MKGFHRAFENAQTTSKVWLPDMDLNHDKQIQSLLCYRYTIGQTGVAMLEPSPMESSRQPV
jgi:hypothetical protein